MSAQQLQRERAQLVRRHRDAKRKVIASGTTVAVGLIMTPFTGGYSLIGAGVGSARTAVNREKVKAIERELNQKGWAGHKLGIRDFVLPVAIGAVGVAVGGALDSTMDSGDAGDTGTTYTYADTSNIDASNFDTSNFDTSGLGDATIDGGDAFGESEIPPTQDVNFIGTDSSVYPPPTAMDLPVISWDVTDEGVQMVINGVPVDTTYGQLDPSGFYQVPVDPNDFSAGSILMWSDPCLDGPESFDANGFDEDICGQEDLLNNTEFVSTDPTSSVYPAGIDEVISELTQPISGTSDYSMPIGDPFAGFTPTLPNLSPGLDAYTDPTMQFGDLSQSEDPVAQFSDFGQFDYPLQSEEFQPLTSDPSGVTYNQYVPNSGIGAQTALAGVTMVAVHAAPHLLPHLLSEGLKEGVESAAKKGAWKLGEKLEDKHYPSPGLQTVTPQKPAEKQDFYDQQREKQEEKVEIKVAENDTINATKSNNISDGTREDVFDNLPPHQKQCLVALRSFGYDAKLNEPERLKFFIEQADGNIVYAKAWIDEFVRSKL
jgi:hypothetical protein